MQLGFRKIAMLLLSEVSFGFDFAGFSVFRERYNTAMDTSSEAFGVRSS